MKIIKPREELRKFQKTMWMMQCVCQPYSDLFTNTV